MYAAALTEAVSSDLCESSGILAFYQSVALLRKRVLCTCDPNQLHFQSILLQNCQAHKWKYTATLTLHGIQQFQEQRCFKRIII